MRAAQRLKNLATSLKGFPLLGSEGRSRATVSGRASAGYRRKDERTGLVAELQFSAAGR
jgi:hypothetical protein